MTESLLTRDQILQAEDLPSETVTVLEWGGSVIVRGLTGSERGKFQNSILSQNGKAPGVGNVDMKEAETIEFKKSLTQLKAGSVSISAILNKHGAGEFPNAATLSLPIFCVVSTWWKLGGAACLSS